MRLLLSLVFLALPALPVSAQSEGFDPYQAALDGMPLETARPQLESLYGPLVDMAPQVDPAFAEAGNVLLYKDDPAKPVGFLFCAGKLSAFSAIVSPDIAARILEALNMPIQPPTEVYASGNGVMIRYPDSEVSTQYWGIGTADSYVSVNYPYETISRTAFAKRCEEVAGKS